MVSIEVASRARRRRAPTARPPNEPFGFRRPETPRRGTGTGFLIDAAGHLLTNQHVIDGAERVTVKLDRRPQLPRPGASAPTPTPTSRC